MKILAANDKIRCVRCSRQPSYGKRYFFVTSEEAPETSFTINTVCIFLTMKNALELERLDRLLLKFLCHVDIQESFREDSATFDFLVITWESKRSW